MRRVAVNNYVIFYDVNNQINLVRVVRIFYAGRDIYEFINE